MRSRWLQVRVQEPARPTTPNVCISIKSNTEAEVGGRHKSEGHKSDAEGVTQGLFSSFQKL